MMMAVRLAPRIIWIITGIIWAIPLPMVPEKVVVLSSNSRMVRLKSFLLKRTARFPEAIRTTLLLITCLLAVVKLKMA